jgi:thiol-disulfide isomerase/thioredoxin
VKSSELVIGAPAPEFKARTLTGQAVRLDTYIGHPVAFLFVSPVCGHCRMEVPKLLKLAVLAKKNADVEFVLVSDWGPLRTQQWLESMRLEDGVEVTVSVLVAPRGKSDFLDNYNPKQAIPGFCLLDAQGTVQATGPISSTEWNTFKRIWEGVSRLSPLIFSKYQWGSHTPQHPPVGYSSARNLPTKPAATGFPAYPYATIRWFRYGEYGELRIIM